VAWGGGGGGGGHLPGGDGIGRGGGDASLLPLLLGRSAGIPLFIA
jgi:hypothetical protein